MTKQLEIIKLFDQITMRSCRIMAPVEPTRYVVVDGFIVYMNDRIVNSFTINLDKHTISGNNKQGSVITDEFEYGFYDIVEYALYKEIP